MSGARWPWAVVAAAAVLAFVSGVGAGLAPHPRPAASSAAPSPAAARTHAPTPNVLAELARPQQPEDLPRSPVGHRLQVSTFRVIDTSVLSDLYVARDVTGRICIVAVPIDDQFAAACGADATGLRTPLLLLYTVVPPGEGPVAALAGLDSAG
ncbi:MAG: hypothetical protein ACTHJL_09090 [Amnibacterium sp.]